MNKNQKGFGAIGVLLILIVLGIVSFTGWYVWSSTNKVNSNLDAVAGANIKESKISKTSDKVSYKSSYSKFSITMPSNYVIIVRHDGPGEGLGATDLTIGDKTSTDGIVDSSDDRPVTITAYPLNGGSFKTQVDEDLKDMSPFGKSNLQIDGVTADTYMLGGMAAPENIYFTKNDIFYKIALGDTNATIKQKLDAIVSGFKFE